MNFKIVNIEYYVSPNDLNVDQILSSYGTSVAALENVIKNSEIVYHNFTDGFQIELAEQLKTIFEQHFHNIGGQLEDIGYSTTMGEIPDVAVGRKGHPKKIFVEIEFRPNEHKDIVKFLIGHKKQTLELGILIVAMNRKTVKVINKKYHTMPTYSKCIQIIKELQCGCPMLVIGFDGQMSSSELVEI